MQLAQGHGQDRSLKDTPIPTWTSAVHFATALTEPLVYLAASVLCPGWDKSTLSGSAGEEPTVWGGVWAHKPAAMPPCPGGRGRQSAHRWVVLNLNSCPEHSDRGEGDQPRHCLADLSAEGTGDPDVGRCRGRSEVCSERTQKHLE